MIATTRANRVQIHGPLQKHAEGFEAELLRLGFTPASIVNQFYLLAHLSRWLEAESMRLGDLTVLQVDAFLAERKATHTAPDCLNSSRHTLGSTVIMREVVRLRATVSPCWSDALSSSYASDQ